jgi:hypothetical protein
MPIIALVGIIGTTLREEIGMTAVMDLEAPGSLMYPSDMADVPELEKELAIKVARNHFGRVVERARYFDISTYLDNRGQLVGAVVPIELAKIADELGGPAAAVRILKAHLESARS